MSRDRTPTHDDFPTRRYDLVKEFVIALVVVLVLSGGVGRDLLIARREGDHHVRMGEGRSRQPRHHSGFRLAGTTTSATYGAPYNTNAEGQKLGPLPLQKWGGSESR